jgi:hypothetical protein
VSAAEISANAVIVSDLAARIVSLSGNQIKVSVGLRSLRSMSNNGASGQLKTLRVRAQHAVVDSIERLCGLIDRVPGVWIGDGEVRLWRHAQYGCAGLHLAHRAIALAERWQLEYPTSNDLQPGRESPNPSIAWRYRRSS